MIKKPNKDPCFPQNHRPISLLPTLGKVYERVINSRLLSICDENEVIPDEQCGFRSEHGTQEQLLRVTDFISRSLNENKFALGVFLDIERAFDSVWHPAILLKLINHNFPSNLVKLVKNFLTGRTFRIKVNHSLSDVFNITAGVPQGAVLSPTLFNIFASDLPNSLELSPHGNLIVASYADDVALIVKSGKANLAQEYLQSAITKITKWYRTNRIQLNADKTVLTLFTRNYEPPSLKLKINSQIIQSSNEAKYLGVILDSKLKFSSHITKTLGKAYAAKNKLFPLLRHSSKLNLLNKKLIYTSFIRPLLTYGAPIWHHMLTKTNKKKLQVFQNKFVRLITKAPWYCTNAQLHKDVDLELLSDHVAKLTNNFANKINVHPNKIISDLSKIDITQSKIPRPLFNIKRLNHDPP